MRAPYNQLFLAVAMAFVIASCSSRTIFVKADDPAIRYMGRTAKEHDAALIYWSGSSVTMNFEGTDLRAKLKDEHGDNMFYIVIDSVPVTKLRPDTLENSYMLAKGLKPGKHTVQLYKLTEGAHGKTWFYGYEVKGSTLPANAQLRRRIEFYGNSITSGYSLEDSVDDSRAPWYFNNYLAYPSLTARHYNADFHCISRSGIGLMLSWFPIIMPEMYDRLDPLDSRHKWDFTSYTPQVVVVNLLENDSWLVKKPDFHQFKARFGDKAPTDSFIVNAYKNFVQNIRGKYPQAYIICVLGSMDATQQGSPWPGYVERAVHEMNDPKIFAHFFPFQGNDRHPKVKDHEAIARDLIGFIDQHVSW